MPIFERAPKTVNEPKSTTQTEPKIESESSASPEPSPAAVSDEALTSPQSHPVDLSNVGEHVAAVLGAAETSANKLREQAEQERDLLSLGRRPKRLTRLLPLPRVRSKQRKPMPNAWSTRRRQLPTPCVPKLSVMQRSDGETPRFRPRS